MATWLWPGPEVLHGEAADVRRDVLNVCGAAHRAALLGGRGDGEGHVEQGLLALHGGDRDLLGQLRLERELELLRRAGLHVDLLGHPPETLYRHRHGIGTWRHGLRVASGCIGDDGP